MNLEFYASTPFDINKHFVEAHVSAYDGILVIHLTTYAKGDADPLEHIENMTRYNQSYDKAGMRNIVTYMISCMSVLLIRYNNHDTASVVREEFIFTYEGKDEE